MITGIDHCGLAVDDLAAARARFAAMGFMLSPRETLTRPGPDGGPADSGADNHVIMFDQGYQELIAITDPAKGHMLLPRLARYWGLHILVLGSDDAEADRAEAVARGARVSACATWGREIAGMGEARFRFFLFEADEAPECLLCVVEHLTPELLRPAHLLEHANAATGLDGCILAVADLAEASARYRRLLGRAGKGGLFGFPNGTELRLADAAWLARAYPEAVLPAAPAFVAARYSIGDMARLRQSGLDFQPDGDGVWLGPADAFGAVLAFRPSE